MKTQKTYKVFIGSDNETKKLNSKKIKQLANKYFLGFTFYKAVGFWKGKPENTAILEITETEKSDKQKVLFLATELKTELKQESILITEQSQKALFI